jgi:hypothetical protein
MSLTALKNRVTQFLLKRQCSISDKADNTKNTNDYIWDNKMAISLEPTLKKPS